MQVDIMGLRANFFSFGGHGAHQAWTEGEDVVHIRWCGDVSAEDVYVGAKAFELVPNRDRGFFLVMHVKDQGRFEGAARKAITSDPRSAWVRAVVVVGASFQMRIVMLMIGKAMRALGVGQAPQEFVESDADVPREIEKARRTWNATKRA